MAVKTQNPTALLRRPLPPKVLSPLPKSCAKKKKTERSHWKAEKQIIKVGRTPLSRPNNTATEPTCGCKHVYGFDTVVHSLKPQGPDPLPARIPRRVREHPYEMPMDARFAPSSPLFTLHDFLRRLDNDKKVTERSVKKVLGRSDDMAWKALQELSRQEELYRKTFDADSAELPKRLPRKPQRQIIIELAAAILSNEGSNLDERITEILEQVQVPLRRDPAWFARGLRTEASEFHADLGSALNGVEECSELLSLGMSDTSDVTDMLTRSLRFRQQMDDEVNTAVISKGETYPQSEVLLSRSPTSFFQGTARCSSPFRNDDREHETMLTAAEFVILEAIVRGYSTLDLKAHFIDRLPDIQSLSRSITAVNLSFNNFRVFPYEIFALKNLVSLNLRNNPLKEIPHEIGQLFRLRTFVIPFCLVSSLPLSLFSLKHLKVLDLAYNRLSFIPTEIGKLRSLIELSVEGNELGALPTGILKLNLNHLRIANNFTHHLFWKETTSNQPQRLFHMAAQAVVSCSLVNSTMPEELRKQLLKPEICDCCDGPVFGPGVRIIKTVDDIYGLKSMPFIFTVCSQTCRKAFKKNTESVRNWLEKNCPKSDVLVVLEDKSRSFEGCL